MTARREHARRFAHPGAEILDIAGHQRRTDEVEAARRETAAGRHRRRPAVARSALWSSIGIDMSTPTTSRAPADCQKRKVASGAGADVQGSRGGCARPR